MSNLEIALTLVVWALVGCVFLYYRSLAVRQQQNLDRSGDHPRLAAGCKGRQISS